MFGRRSYPRRGLRFLCAILIGAGAAGCAGTDLSSPSLALPSPVDASADAAESAMAEGSATSPNPPQPERHEQTSAYVPPPQAHAGGADGDRIVAFKGETVILYTSEDGNHGQRVPAASLPLPLKAKSVNSTRFEVATAEGTRWISKADVRTGP